MNHRWIVNKEDENSRLLSFIKKRIQEKTTAIRFAIEHQGCRVNQKIERFCSKKLRIGETVEFSLEKGPKLELQQKAVLFEDEHILIYAKPTRIASEELAKCFQLELVHRLDRDTTGILIFAKHTLAREKMEEIFKKREIQKSYLAIVHGHCHFDHKTLHNKLVLVKRLPGKVIWGIGRNEGVFALTEVTTHKRAKEYSFLQLHPKTGRTHQLRVQLSHIGHPIVGDVDYGKKEQWDKHLLLHAHELHFTHPYTNENISIECPLPSDFKKCLTKYF